MTASDGGTGYVNIKDFTLTANDFGVFGRGLMRPECVSVEGDSVWASDARGGIARVHPTADPTVLGTGIATPNGFNRRPDGTFVVAGLDDGTIYTVAPDGRTSVLLNSIEGVPIGAVNYPCCDGDRLWISVMTTDLIWSEAIRGPAKGRIVLLDKRGPRIVADGLHLANEVKVSPSGQHLYVAETIRRRILRFPIHEDGSLGEKEVVGPADLGVGAFPDGFTFDADGNIWVTIIVRNGLYVITPDGDLHIVFEDVRQDALDTLVSAVEQQTATPEHMAACAGHGPLLLPTSLAFGGVDGRDLYVGSLALDHLATFRSPTRGV